MQLKRPILIGGLGLSASFWLLNAVGHTPVGHFFADVPSLLGALALGSGILWFNRRKTTVEATPAVVALKPATKDAIESAISEATQTLETLMSELPEDVHKSSLRSQIEQTQFEISALDQSQERESLSVVIVGSRNAGKTTLQQQLKENWQPQHSAVTQIEEVSTEDVLPVITSDLVLFVASGDLTQSELERLRTLVGAGYRLHVVFNKQDLLTPDEQSLVLQQIRARLSDLEIGVSAIAANPNPVTVRKHSADGTVTESVESSLPQLHMLTSRLDDFVTKDAQQLILTTTLRQANALARDAQTLLNQHRRTLALPMIEQMQWIAAGSAFASPLPSVDLIASTAINGQLIADLGGIYGQSFSLDQAKTAATAIAELLVKLGLVELSTQALGSLLKTHAATYVAGGALQGVSAAYLTRIVGLSLVGYFEEQSLLPERERTLALGQMGDRLQTIFQATKQTLDLKAFVQQTLTHLPKPQAAAVQYRPD